MKKKVLFLCTGNSARSQMAEALVNHDFAGEIQAFSAGTEPQGVNPNAIKVMSEMGIDISGNESKHLSQFEDRSFDYVITLCDQANDNCPLFFGGAKRIHMGFPDPAKATGSNEEILGEFRCIRDKIRARMNGYFETELKNSEGG